MVAPLLLGLLLGRLSLLLRLLVLRRQGHDVLAEAVTGEGAFGYEARTLDPAVPE